MSTIDRVEIHGFTYEVPNLGLPEHGAAGVGNWVYRKGSKVKASRYAVRIRTDDGLSASTSPTGSARPPRWPRA